MAPFVAYLPAEELHASGVLAVVVAGLLLGHRSRCVQNALLPAQRADQLAHHPVPAGELGVPADRPAGAADRGRRRPAPTSAAADRRASAWPCSPPSIVLRPIWVFPALPADAARSRRRDRPSPVLAVHRDHLVGGHARGGHARRGVHAARGHAHRGGPGPDRHGRHRRHADAAGLPLPWLARGSACADPTRARTPCRRRPSCRRRSAAGLRARSRSAPTTTTPTIIGRAAPARRAAHQHRLGAAGPAATPTQRDAERGLPAGAAGDARRRARASCCASATPASVDHEVLDARDGRARPRGVDARPGRATHEAAAATSRCCHAEPGRGRVRAPRATPTTRRGPDSPQGCEDCLREGTTLGAPAAVPGLRQRRLLRLLASASTPTAHFHDTGHPVMRSFEPGEAWRWCYVDDLLG